MKVVAVDVVLGVGVSCQFLFSSIMVWWHVQIVLGR
jgi:hypothetical protein